MRRHFKTEKVAVSAVIGTILMVSMVVSLSATIYSYTSNTVSDFEERYAETTQIYFSQADSQTDDTLTVLASIGDIEGGDLEMRINDEEISLSDEGEMNVGSVIDITKVIDENGIAVDETYTVTIVYDNRVSRLIGKYTFTTQVPNNSPYTPSSPDPEDSVTEINVNTDLSWTGGDPDEDPVTYNVYFGTENLPDYVDTVAVESYDPGVLDHETTYYWKIVASDGENTTEGPIWSFTTEVEVEPNNPPNIPSDPDPEDGATDVLISSQLSWTGGDPDGDPVTYDVYFGTESLPDYVDTVAVESYDPGVLDHETTYYWKIVASDGENTTEGPIWSFTTEVEVEPNNPPNIPSDPDPENGTTKVPTGSPHLSWTGGDPDIGDTVTYDVYFGTDQKNMDFVSERQLLTNYDPGILDYETTYYWKIVSWDNHGVSTEGPIWSFTTKAESGAEL